MSSGQFVIRPMSATDVDKVMEIAKSLKNTPHWPRSAYLGALNESAEPQRIALVAVAITNDCPVGFAIASLVPPSAELETIAVLELWQRQAVGRCLLDKLVEALKVNRVREIWLEVRSSNKAAIALYGKAGFVEKGWRNSYYVDPVEDAAVMCLTI